MQIDQMFPPDDICVCLKTKVVCWLKTGSSFSAPLAGECAYLQESTLIHLHCVDSGNSCCFECVNYLTCVRDHWMLTRVIIGMRHG